MRATYVPDGPAPAAPEGLERLEVTVPAGAPDGGGELTIWFKVKDRRRVRAAIPAGQVRDVLRRWAAAARDGRGALEIGE